LNPLENNNHFCYKFDKTGFIEVKIIMKRELSSLKDLFYDCINLVDVEFSESFDKSHALTIKRIFHRCKSLKNVNILSFNTSLVYRLSFMFYECQELTSLDLPNLDTRNVKNFQSMLKGATKMNWMDLNNSILSYYIDMLKKNFCKRYSNIK